MSAAPETTAPDPYAGRVVKHPRPTQWAEQAAAHRNYQQATDLAARNYWCGVSTGYLVAFLGTDYWTELHDKAKSLHYVAPYTWEEAQTALAGRKPRIYPQMSLWEAAGILFGYKQATAERTDAVECTNCDKRVLFLHDNETLATCQTHGVFCDDDCADSVCGRECAANDDRGHQLPDHYYEDENHTEPDDGRTVDDFDAPMIEAFVRALSERAA